MSTPFAAALAGLGVKLPLHIGRNVEAGVVFDADKKPVATVDVDRDRSDRTAQAIAKLIAEAVKRQERDMTPDERKKIDTAELATSTAVDMIRRQLPTIEAFLAWRPADEDSEGRADQVGPRPALRGRPRLRQDARRTPEARQPRARRGEGAGMTKMSVVAAAMVAVGFLALDLTVGRLLRFPVDDPVSVFLDALAGAIVFRMLAGLP